MSPLWTGATLAAATGGQFGGVPPDAIAGISIDSRTVAAGELFVALVSGTGDGHDHVAGALARGAAAALVHDADRLPGTLRRDPRLLHVADTFVALQALGRAGRDRFRGRVVAVTGSVGKTTTKEMLRAALSAIGPTHAAAASHNNHWGVPLTLARLPEDARYCVCEIGMNHPGEIAPLAAMVRPHVAVVTTVAAAHLGHMGSLEAIAVEKAAIFSALEPGGTAILPADAPHADRLARAAEAAGARIVRFGVGGDARLERLELDAGGCRAMAVLGDRRVRLRLAAAGAHMAANALACLVAVQALDGDPEAAAAALAGFVAGDGRGALRRLPLPGGGTASLLDESYNASGASVRAALSVLALLPARRRVVVLGDMLELGDFARAEHEDLRQPVCDAADVVFCAGGMTLFLFDRLPESIRGGHARDARGLAPIVAAALRDGDVVLVKGSHGSRMRDVVSALVSLSTAMRGADAA